MFFFFLTNFAFTAMIFFLRNIFYLFKGKYLILWFCLAMGLSSCFTGIESTKKINMTREDKRRTAPTPEEIFFSGIDAIPLKDWQTGKIFIASDNKALLLFDSYRASLFPDTSYIKGKELQFKGIQSNIDASGKLTLAIMLTDGNRVFHYDTGKEFDNAMESITSNSLPMLIDKEMVEEAARLLTGTNLWTRSNLWYNEDEERIEGKKYVPVTITGVQPGNMIFPLKLELTSAEGQHFYMFMNFGNAPTESRSFHNLFSISDLRKQYPNIEPEIWNLICEGKVTIGMTKQEARLSLGNPIDISSGHDYSQTIDIWTYDNGKILWFEDGKIARYKG